MKRFLFALVWLVFSYTSVAHGADRLRIAYSSISGAYTGIWVAHDAGFFAKEGLEDQVILIPSATQLAQVTVAGDVDIASLGGGPMIAAALSGADLKVFGNNVNKMIFSLHVKPEIKSIEELRGKRIGLSVGTTTQALVHELLKLNGLDPDKGFEYVNIPGAAARIAALEKGLVAAAPMSAPGDLKAIHAGFKRLVFFGDVLPEISATGLIASAAYIKENPRVVEKMVRAIVRGTLAARDEPATAIEVMQSSMKMNPDDARETYRLVRKSLAPVLTEAGVRNMAGLVSGSAKIPQTKEPREYMDTVYLNRALSELPKK
jgi:NitT/TauT family transport system substrate-binding protein